MTFLGMSNEGILPRVLGRVHPGRQTPWVAIARARRHDRAAAARGLSTVNAAVLVLRRDPVAHRHFRAPTAVPVIGVAVSIGLMTTKEPETFARAGVLLVVGVALGGSTGGCAAGHLEAYDTQLR